MFLSLSKKCCQERVLSIVKVTSLSFSKKCVKNVLVVRCQRHIHILFKQVCQERVRCQTHSYQCQRSVVKNVFCPPSKIHVLVTVKEVSSRTCSVRCQSHAPVPFKEVLSGTCSLSVVKDTFLSMPKKYHLLFAVKYMFLSLSKKCSFVFRDVLMCLLNPCSVKDVFSCEKGGTLLSKTVSYCSQLRVRFFVKNMLFSFSKTSILCLENKWAIVVDMFPWV
ncbi:hypothetical protein BaRGS_00036756 [Batillaria attramentaria]|uniref:Uncharacterized protein n=1 Tax=Batillaria attramentaria TaxID=370345 RepID=A0ABD0JAJ4_9CAEN